MYRLKRALLPVGATTTVSSTWALAGEDSDGLSRDVEGLLCGRSYGFRVSAGGKQSQKFRASEAERHEPKFRVAEWRGNRGYG